MKNGWWLMPFMPVAVLAACHAGGNGNEGKKEVKTASAPALAMADNKVDAVPPPPPPPTPPSTSGPGPGAMGKRAAPAEVAPLKVGKISYQVVHWGRMRDLPQNGGYLAAVDESGRELWIQQIYNTAKDAALEGDVQDVFITALSLAADGKTLEISDERGRSYRFDPQARKLLP